ncbi:hypothetical protein [Bacillus sp. SKDU12]|uniref:hypothetical protein n=1 Tax=Bacillus sp. SKDU12 TaxID=1337053 RepID=UPI003AFA1C0D
MINGNAYEKGHYISYVAGNIVGTKGAGSAVQTTTKLSKVGKVVEGGTAAAHVNKGINKGKSYLNSFVKNKNDLALVGIAQDIENTYNAKNTPLLKSMIEDKKESVLRRSERSNNKGTGKSTQGARYGERKISDQTYGKLRRASPSSKIQKEVNKNIDDIIGTEDFALPGKIIDKKLHADHIVSLEKMARMEGFETLTYKQQKEVANFVENFIGLSEAANTSKGPKSYADWYIYKKENIPVNAEFRKKMILKEKELEIEIQKMIDEFNNINKKGGDLNG